MKGFWVAPVIFGIALMMIFSQNVFAKHEADTNSFCPSFPGEGPLIYEHRDAVAGDPDDNENGNVCDLINPIVDQVLRTIDDLICPPNCETPPGR